MMQKMENEWSEFSGRPLFWQHMLSATTAFSTTCTVHIEDCEGWWLSSCHSSVAEHWQLKPKVSWVWLLVAAGLCIYVCLSTIKTPEMGKPQYSIKQTGSPVPTVPELHEIYSISHMFVYQFCKIAHHHWWIQIPGIILALSLIVLTFLNIVWQWRSPKKQPHCAQLPKYPLYHASWK